jgi:hypothetical protein
MKTKTLKSLVAVGAAALLSTSSASALTFIATGNGPITAYFFGETAGYGSRIGMSVNGVSTGTYGLQNHTAEYGDFLVLGNVNAGDVIVFELQVAPNEFFGPPPGYEYSVFSNPSLNSDGLEHTVASSFGGDVDIPAGTLVGFEDIIGLGDQDFDDHQFVFTGVQDTSVPDGGTTLALLGIALGGLRFMRRKV